jgi:glutamate-1-semialdehyde 2,1-aminomutase
MSRNDELFEQAQAVIPGGVNSPVRAFRAVGGTPRFFARGEGAYFWDADGKRYIDYVGSWGPLILGHAHASVVEIIKRAAERGTTFGAPTELEAEMARLVVDAVPSIDLVRFVNSGTEATMSALRLARGYTGRDKIVKFEGCYHGHSDSLLVKAGSGALTFGVPTSAGVPPEFAAHTLTLSYNDIEQVQQAFAALGREIACIIVEPVAGNMNCVPPVPGFLDGLREICTRHGALLIFDEVQSGTARTGRFLAAEHFGVRADITVLSKALGGGLPLSAAIGPAAVMNDPRGLTITTTAGNPISAAAGRAVLRTILAENLMANAAARGAELLEGLRQLANKHALIGDVRGRGLLVGLELVRDRKSLEPAAPETKRVVNRMRDLGVLTATEGPHGNVLKLRPPICFSSAQADMTIAALDQALSEL